MRIKWLGHSAFLLSAADGTAIITDPYLSGSFNGEVKYGSIHDAADVVTVSHHHQDHDGVSGLPGKPKVIEGRGSHKVGSVSIVGVETFHDENQGAGRGRNTVFVFDADGVRVCHCGDLGHVLTAQQASAIGKVDVLLVPVGGTFTVDAAGARKVAAQLAATVIIPMHYKTDKLGFPIAGLEDFTQGEQNVKRVGSAEVELSAHKLPPEPEIWVLDHAL
ncbi:MBL fold metallo-hydrolase [candidate division WOR-3 bacterium]|uniref:MBL fold metallo-hydrolase n=1 Tax=candidate division WOR-3 bacterium TaxID=2052148 RepID=A0A937XGQ8_UNCW3|nr:MBL fold metallo-hydrolase [candidate division WOR-3 bacterium]